MLSATTAQKAGQQPCTCRLSGNYILSPMFTLPSLSPNFMSAHGGCTGREADAFAFSEFFDVRPHSSTTLKQVRSCEQRRAHPTSHLFSTCGFASLGASMGAVVLSSLLKGTRGDEWELGRSDGVAVSVGSCTLSIPRR